MINSIKSIRNVSLLKILLFVGISLSLCFPSSTDAAMENYCLVPPNVVNASAPPNILIAYEKGIDIKERAYSTTYIKDIDSPYYGFFDASFNAAGKSTSNYTAQIDSSGNFEYFIKDTCTPDETNNCFPGDVLNWALMSALDLSRKVLIGFGLSYLGGGDTAGEVFTYTGDLVTEGLWDDDTTGENVLTVTADYTDDGITYTTYTFELKVAIGGNPTELRSVKKGSTEIIDQNNDGWVRMKFTDERRTGLMQKYLDKDQDMLYDIDAPRIDMSRWHEGGGQDKQSDIMRDVPALTDAERLALFKSKITVTARSPAVDSTTPYLGDMMEEMVRYMSGQSANYTDTDNETQTPYDWSNDPLAPCRKTFTLFMITGTHLGENGADELSPLPAACSSLTYPAPDASSPIDAFPANTCYAYNTDLYTSDSARQNISTFIVHTTFYGTGADNENKLRYSASISDGMYFKVDNGKKLEAALEDAMLNMLSRASSGTAAAALAPAGGSGASFTQAAFYPKRKFNGTEIKWIGMLQNLWYYIDPFFANSSIREDTDGNRELHLQNDYISQFYFNSDEGKTLVRRFQDTNGDGSSLVQITPDIAFEDLTNLWEAGKLLWSRNLSTDPRTIKTTTGTGLIDFSTGNAATLQPYLQAADIAEAQNIINYIHGYDISEYRNRTVTIDLNNDGDTDDAGEGPYVWKLGDIINSTPATVSWTPLNTYDTAYHDNTYYNFINSSSYQNRGMVFVGANDGMLHAFKLGKLTLYNDVYKKADLTGSNLGKEEWSFIPENVLPYLKYNADPSYCHIYNVDAQPYVFDASIGGNSTDIRPPDGSSWRTVLIGSMRYGGACRDTASTCTDCVKTPESGKGYSSYFALDITDQNNPVFLWEFTNEALGFTTTGPAVVRISTKNGTIPEGNTNGEWFVVLASGPTGPVNTAQRQFMGRSDQTLKLFILDLKTGDLKRTIDTGIAYAFGGFLESSTLDPDLDYQDDVAYFGYTFSSTGSGNTWTNGGVLRLMTKEDTEPLNWTWSKVIDNIGAVTSSVERMEDTNTGKLWLYFGTGRYFYKLGTTVDDPDTLRKLFGIKEPCYSGGSIDTACSTAVSEISLTEATDTTAANPDNPGWYINLDAAGTTDKAERVITNPIASTSGVVFFTTFKPRTALCGSYNGQSYVWAVKYNTGGSATTQLKGKALIQVSTGAIEEIDLATAFTERGSRRTGDIEGDPPAGRGLTVLTSPFPMKKVIHTRER
ncbi:MAG: hypothetical protein GXO95_02670 [Nitrospirae bacterium]|nr:hypothetical protein [Nitrospirota bacterium]